jgi:hypothetical protein
MQKDEGIHPLKLLLLALSATRFPVFFHVADGKYPEKKLLEMFSTCSEHPAIDDGSSSRVPVRRLKLTSRETMLLDEITSNGRPPPRELLDRLRRSMPLSPPRDGETCPFQASGWQGDLGDLPVGIAGYAVPCAAAGAVPPRLGEAAIPGEPSEELEQGALLLGT